MFSFITISARLGLIFFVMTLSGGGRAEPGLLRTIWSCHLPCASKIDHALLGYIEVGYCSTSALTPAMFDALTPTCQQKTRDPNAIAVRAEPAMVGRCLSSGNTCPKEGTVRAAFTCNTRCPSQGLGIRKFTACAANDEEAWSFAKQICPDAVPPESTYFAPAHVCHVEGQTPCE